MGIPFKARERLVHGSGVQDANALKGANCRTELAPKAFEHFTMGDVKIRTGELGWFGHAA
jgi:hypothetical protein